MLKIHNVKRGSGKTTGIIERMKNDKSIICIVPFSTMKKFYPEELHRRILAANSPHFFTSELNWYAKTHTIVFDEGFMMSGDKLAEFYYRLGQEGISMEVYGTAH